MEKWRSHQVDCRALSLRSPLRAVFQDYDLHMVKYIKRDFFS